MKDYVDLKDVKQTTIKDRILTCPNCGYEHTSLTGQTIETLEKDMRDGIDTGQNYREAALNSRKLDGLNWYYTCNGCAHIFTQQEMLNENWVTKEIGALECPLCYTVTPKNLTNKNSMGYVCKGCHNMLEYDANPHQCGSGKDVRIDAVSGYVRAFCPNCNAKNMKINEGIWVEKGKLSVPMKCSECSFQETLFFLAPYNLDLNVHFEDGSGEDSNREEVIGKRKELREPTSDPKGVREVVEVVEQSNIGDGKEGSDAPRPDRKQYASLDERIARIKEDAYRLKSKDKESGVKIGSPKGTMRGTRVGGSTDVSGPTPVRLKEKETDKK